MISLETCWAVKAQPWQRPATTNVYKTRSCNYSLEATDDEREYRSKHVEQSRKNGIINCPTQLHLVGHFSKIRIMTHGSMNKSSNISMFIETLFSAQLLAKRDFEIWYLYRAKFLVATRSGIPSVSSVHSTGNYNTSLSNTHQYRKQKCFL